MQKKSTYSDSEFIKNKLFFLHMNSTDFIFLLLSFLKLWHDAKVLNPCP
jgi:hypothetical protein